MEKFVAENYSQAIRDIGKIFELLHLRGLHASNQAGFENMLCTADGMLAASVEIWKHYNPWVQREYGEEPF